MTENQKAFMKDLTADLKRLFFCREPDAGEIDYCAWFCGVLRKHDARRHADCVLETYQDVWAYLLRLETDQAIRLISAMGKMRERMEQALTREQLQTPPPILTAIWTAASRSGHGRDDVHAMVHAVTGEWCSSKNLRRAEAVEVLRRVGGNTRIFEMTPPRSQYGRPGLRERNTTVL